MEVINRVNNKSGHSTLGRFSCRKKLLKSQYLPGILAQVLFEFGCGDGE